SRGASNGQGAAPARFRGFPRAPSPRWGAATGTTCALSSASSTISSRLFRRWALSKCDLEIHLDQKERTYRPGAWVLGEVTVDLDAPVQCRRLSVTLNWRT